MSTRRDDFEKLQRRYRAWPDARHPRKTFTAFLAGDPASKQDWFEVIEPDDEAVKRHIAAHAS